MWFIRVLRDLEEGKGNIEKEFQTDISRFSRLTVVLWFHIPKPVVNSGSEIFCAMLF